MANIKLQSDLAALLLALEPHAQALRDGRDKAPDQDTMLAYRRVGGAVERLMAKAKLEQVLNRRGGDPA